MPKTALPDIYIHGTWRYLVDFAEGKHPAMLKIFELFEDRGVKVHIADIKQKLWRGASKQSCHFVFKNIKADVPILYVGPGFAPETLTIDAHGFRNYITMSQAKFDPQAQPPAGIEENWRYIHKHILPNRQTLRKQVEPSDSPVPKNSIVYFLQGLGVDQKALRYLDDEVIIEALASHDPSRPILVKPHPIAAQQLSSKELKMLQKRHPNIIISTHHVHDLLRNAALTASVNSAASFEGYFFEKPTLLFGESAFPHIAEVVKEAADIHPALDRAFASTPPFQAYCYWVMQTQLFHARQSDLFKRVVQKMTEAGLDCAAFR